MDLLVKDKKFSIEAEASIKNISLIVDKMRLSFHKSAAMPADLHSLFDRDDILLFRSAMVTLFAEMDLSYALVESGLPMGSSFGDEAIRIIKSKILPYVYDECDLRLVVRKIFHDKKDSEMLNALSMLYGNEWIESDSSLLIPDIVVLQNLSLIHI